MTSGIQRRRWILLLVCVGTNCSLAVTDSQLERELSEKLNTVDHLIQSMDPAALDYVDWTVVQHRLPVEFWEISKQSTKYRVAAERLLKTGRLSVRQQDILILMMVSLNLPEYLDFLGALLAMLETQKIAQSTFRDYVFPLFEFDTKIVENYNDPRVRSKLEAALNSAFVKNETKTMIRDRIITGKTLERLVDLREMGQIRK